MCLACFSEQLKGVSGSLSALRAGLDSAGVLFSQTPEVSLQVRCLNPVLSEGAVPGGELQQGLTSSLFSPPPPRPRCRWTFWACMTFSSGRLHSMRSLPVRPYRF